LDLVTKILEYIIDENTLLALNNMLDPGLRLLLPILLRLNSYVFKTGRASKDLTSLLVDSFSRLYVLYEPNPGQQELLLRQVTQVTPRTPADGREWAFVLHISAHVFTACLNLDMIDPHLWSLLASLDPPSSIVVLSGFAWFTTYYAVSVADTLLRFSFLDTDRTDFPELCAMNEWLPPRDFDEVRVFRLSSRRIISSSPDSRTWKCLPSLRRPTASASSGTTVM
jgi:hypothetical protein